MGAATSVDRIAPRRAVWAVLVLAAACACGGCTVCPDPFDYSGPVPDGSPPQNDFRARSGGIHPLNGAAKPWPPLVRDDGAPSATPALADPEPQLVEDDAAAGLQQTSVLVADHGAGGADGAEPLPTVSAEGPVAPLGPVPSDHAADFSEEPTPTPAEPPPVPRTAPPPAEPAETPGWRPRRRPAG